MRRRKLGSTIIRAYAPASISLIFTIEESKHPAKMGSRGVGFTVAQGVTVTTTFARAALANRHEISLNGKPIHLATVETMLSLLAVPPVLVELESKLPLGCGFGLSAASAYATALAVSKLFDLKKSRLELAKIVHIAEVVNGTGLGDVVNLYYGGFCLKEKISSSFAVKKLPISESSVYYRIFSPLFTKSIISDKSRKKIINKYGMLAFDKIKKLYNGQKLSLGHILDISFQFVDKAGLLTDKKTRETINKIRLNGGHASMIILGNGVISSQPFLKSQRLTISENPATVI